MKKNKKGFTLVEVMISLFLSAVVGFFVYSMMLSSYSSYVRLSSVSKNANSIRYFITMFSNSIKDCKELPTCPTTSGTSITFKKYDKNGNLVTEEYSFVGGGSFIKNSDNSSKVAKLKVAAYNTGNLGLLKIKTTVGSGTPTETVLSNIIRTIYFNVSGSSSDRMRKMNIGIIYDDVVAGKVTNEGKLTANTSNNMTDINNTNTINRRLYCFGFRGFNA